MLACGETRLVWCEDLGHPVPECWGKGEEGEEEERVFDAGTLYLLVSQHTQSAKLMISFSRTHSLIHCAHTHTHTHTMQKAMSVLQLRFEEGRDQETSTRLLDFVFDETESETANSSSRDTAWSGQANTGFSSTVITVYVAFMNS